MTALRGLSWGQRWLYVCIRQHMDPATLIAGGRGHALTWHLLADELFVEPGPGRERTGRPTRAALRRMGDALESAGLVRRHSVERVLIFECPKAAQESCAQKKPGKELHKEPGRPVEQENPLVSVPCVNYEQQPGKELHKEPDILQDKKTRQGESAPVRVKQTNGAGNPLQFGDVFEALRGAGVAIGVATNPRTRQTVAGWVRAGITADQLTIALGEVDRAKQHRASKGEYAPIGPMYLDPIIKRVMAGQAPRVPGNGGGRQPQESSEQRDQRRAKLAAELAARFGNEGAA